IAVLKQTSPTACPSAPRPKPSSTVPSASTRSAVGMCSGQAEAFSMCVMRPLNSRAGGRSQSRKSRIHMHFPRGSIAREEPDHQELVEIPPVLLQSLHCAAIFGKSSFPVEPAGGLVVAGDAELKLLDPAGGVADDGLHQAPAEAQFARCLAPIHAPKRSLVAD